MSGPTPEPVLDTVALRVMAFAHPAGVDVVLTALAAARARFPGEVYDRDEAALPLAADDRGLSELARGLHHARRQVATLPAAEAKRYRDWLQHAAQIDAHLARGTLVIDRLEVEELLLREEHRDRYGIGRGEAACLILAQRYGAQVVFLSSDALACEAAATLGLSYLTLPDVLAAWVDRVTPTVADLDALIRGMRAARFGLKQDVIDRLRRQATS